VQESERRPLLLLVILILILPPTGSWSQCAACGPWELPMNRSAAVPAAAATFANHATQLPLIALPPTLLRLGQPRSAFRG